MNESTKGSKESSLNDKETKHHKNAHKYLTEEIEKIKNNISAMVMDTKTISQENTKLRQEMEKMKIQMEGKNTWGKDKLDLVRRLEQLEDKLTEHLEKKIRNEKAEKDVLSSSTVLSAEPGQELYYLRNVYYEMKRIAHLQTTILRLLFAVIGEPCQ